MDYKLTEEQEQSIKDAMKDLIVYGEAKIDLSEEYSIQYPSPVRSDLKWEQETVDIAKKYYSTIRTMTIKSNTDDLISEYNDISNEKDNPLIWVTLAILFGFFVIFMLLI